MLQSSCLPFVHYASPIIACYFCTMKRFILITIAAIFCSSATIFAQFNTVTQTNAHRKAVPKTTQSTTSEQQPPCSTHQQRDTLAFAPLQNQTEQTDRLPALVSPLRHISVTSPFGYRRDPFTKRKALHNGLDLRANYEPAYAMMHGEVIKVGRDKRSGNYVTLRHGNYHVSYCHLSSIMVRKGEYVYPGIIVGVTGNTGRSTGSHLHLTCKKDGKSINPMNLILSIK